MKLDMKYRTLYYKIDENDAIIEIQENEIPNDKELEDMGIEVDDIFDVDSDYLHQFINELIEEGYISKREKINFFSITLIRKARKKSNSQSFNLGTTIRGNISDYTVIDIETTGKYAKYCEIIELSAIKVRNSQIIDEYSTLIKPKKQLPYEITELTGITDEMLENAPSINEKLPEYLDFIGDDIILGHNVSSFDRHVISRYCSKLGLPLLNNDTLDTLHYAHCCNIDVPDHKLTTLTVFLGINHSDAHRALADCIANFHVYEKLKEKFTGKYIATSYNNKGVAKKLGSGSCSISKQYEDISGKSIVLTGDFQIGKRDDVKTMLEELGVSVKSGVSSKTSYLILGSLGGYGSKLTKAEELKANGKPIEIIKEEEFFICRKQLV